MERPLDKRIATSKTRPFAVFDHVSVGSNDITKAREFYRLVLAPLGLTIVDEVSGQYVDFGISGVAFSVAWRRCPALKADTAPQ